MPPREIAGPAGRLEAILEEPTSAGTIGHDGRVSRGHPDGLRAAVVFAHPHTQFGGTMHTKVVYQAAKALSRIGCAVLRFNFRGVGASAGTFTDGPGEMDDFRAALDFMQRPLSRRAAVGRRDVVRVVGRADGRRGGPARVDAHRHVRRRSRATTSARSSAARSRSSSSRASSTSCAS